MYVDSHCHLHYMEEEIPVSQSVENALNNNVNCMLCVATDLTQMDTIIGITKKHECVYGSAGIHPSEAHQFSVSAKELKEAASDKKIIAIGETGLDYFRGDEHKKIQQEQFASHIQVSKETQKPLIIHTRAAKKDTIDIMRQENASEAGGVMHCFTEDWGMAKQALDLGFYISFSGIITFKNAHDLKELVKKVPLEMMLIETDSPYLAPVPFRGKTNQPSYVVHVAECVAQLKNLSVAEIAKCTTYNFNRLFLKVK